MSTVNRRHLQNLALFSILLRDIFLCSISMRRIMSSNGQRLVYSRHFSQSAFIVLLNFVKPIIYDNSIGKRSHAIRIEIPAPVSIRVRVGVKRDKQYISRG